MRILIVCSANSGAVSPFIAEQIDALRVKGIEVSMLSVRKKGFAGYLSHWPSLIKEIQKYKPSLIHAHSGMSALLAVLQPMVPVVATFHGSDLNIPSLRRFSRIALLLARASVVVSPSMVSLASPFKVHVLPCGVKEDIFNPASPLEVRKKLRWHEEKKYVLFSSSFNNSIKNYPLAERAVALLKNRDVEIVELNGLSRLEVAMYMQASDVGLMTSISEGSPQFVKEAMACGLPLVSTRVGDVEQLFNTLDGCYLSEADPQMLADALEQAFQYREHRVFTKGPQRIAQMGLHGGNIADKLVLLYKTLLR